MSKQERRRVRIAASLGLTVLMSSAILGGVSPLVANAAAEGSRDSAVNEESSIMTVPANPSDTVASLPEGETSSEVVVEETPEAEPEEVIDESASTSDETAPVAPVVTEQEQQAADALAAQLAEADEVDTDSRATDNKAATDEGTWGTVEWRVEENVLYLSGGEGEDTANGALGPLYDARLVEKVVIEGDIVAPSQISSLFMGFANVKEYVGLDRIDTSRTTNMFGVFYANRALSEIDVSSWNVSQVTDMGGLFASSGLTSIDLSAWQVTPGVKLTQAFANMPNLTALNLSNFSATDVYFNLFGTDILSLETLTLGDQTKLVALPTPAGKVWVGEKTGYLFDEYYEGEYADTYRLMPISEARGTWGEVGWRMVGGTLFLEGGTGQATAGISPWRVIAGKIDKIVIQDRLIAPPDISALFQDMVAVTEIEGLDKVDTGQVTNMANAFNGTAALKTANVENWDVSALKNMNLLFAGSGVEVLNLANWQPTASFSTAYSFARMPNLTFLDISSFDFGSNRYLFGSDILNLRTIVLGDQTKLMSVPEVEGMMWIGESTRHYFTETYNGGYADTYHFQVPPTDGNWGTVQWRIEDRILYLSSGEGDNITGQAPWTMFGSELEKVVIEGHITAPTNSSRLFRNLRNVTSIEGTNLIDTSKVADLSEAFENTAALKAIDLTDWDVSKVENIDYLFWGSGVESLDLATWHATEITDAEEAFGSMAGLTFLDISNLAFANPQNLFWYDAPSLQTLVLGDETRIEGVPVPAGQIWVGEKTAHTFMTQYGGGYADTYNLQGDLREGTWGTVRWHIDDDQTLYLSAGIGADTANLSPWPFQVSEIKSVVIQGDVIAPENASNLFAGFSQTTQYSGLDRLDVSQVTHMYGMFKDNHAVASLDVGNWDTSNVAVMWSMFENCTSLSELNLEDWDVSQVDDLDSFLYGTKLEILDLSNWEFRGVYADDAFAGMSELTSLDMTNFDLTQATTERMLMDVPKLEEITLGSNSVLWRNVDYPAGKIWKGETTGHQFSAIYDGGYADTYRLVDGILSYTVVDLTDNLSGRDIGRRVLYGQPGTEIALAEMQLPAGYELPDADATIQLSENGVDTDGVTWHQLTLTRVAKTTTRTIHFQGLPAGHPRKDVQEIKWDWDWREDELPFSSNSRIFSNVVHSPQGGYDEYIVPEIEGYVADVTVIEAKTFADELADLPEDEAVTVTYTELDSGDGDGGSTTDPDQPGTETDNGSGDGSGTENGSSTGTGSGSGTGTGSTGTGAVGGGQLINLSTGDADKTQPLPQTGSEVASGLTLLGLGILGLLGFTKRRKRD